MLLDSNPIASLLFQLVGIRQSRNRFAFGTLFHYEYNIRSSVKNQVDFKLNYEG